MRRSASKTKVEPCAISPEFELLLLCARTKLDEVYASRIEELLPQDFDWTGFVRQAIDHQVLPLVYQSLRCLPAGAVPTDVMTEFQQQSNAVLRNNLSFLTKLFRVLQLLAEADIPCIPYKGPSLAVLAYGGNFGLRPFGDLDILVPAHAYEKTRDLFRARGYRDGADWGWESSMVDPTDDLAVDIHRAITPAQFPVRLDFAALHQRLRGVPVGGCEIRSLCPEDMLIVLSIQLAKDSWEDNPLRLSKVCDIAELLRSHPDLNWRQIVDESRRLHCEYILAFGLAFSEEILGAPGLAPQLRGLPRRNYEMLSLHVKGKLLNHMSADYRRSLSRNGFQVNIRERRRDKLYPYLWGFATPFRPSHLDREFVHLPQRLQLLYYLVRPMRILRDLWQRRHDSDANPRPDSSKQ